MAKKPYTNTTDRIQHVGTVTLFPNTTREVEETLIPSFKARPAQPDENTGDDVLVEILDHTVADLEDVLPTLTNDELDVLADAEEAGKNRKTVLEQIQSIKLDRASENQE